MAETRPGGGTPELWFTLQNLGSALLGGVFGLLVALATEFPAVLFKTARKFVLFQQGHLSSQTPSLGNPRRARFLSLEAPGAMHDVHVAQTNHAALD